MPDEYISREAALMKLMQDGCSANKTGCSMRSETRSGERPPPTLRRWCGAGIVPSITLYWAAICARRTRADQEII